YQDRELDMGIRLGALRMYRSHLIDQYSDRCCFWSLRDLSCDLMSRTVTVVTDGADQAKYMVPRAPTLKTAYRSAKYIRPKLKVHGAWAAGWALTIIIVEENSYAGSSLVIELLAMLLQDIANICEESNRASPTTLVVVGGNTVKELKNTFCLSAIANLCNHNKYRSLCWVEILFCLLSLSLSHTFWLFM
ncbi:Uncharacterized protein SCF082_LOCUS11982, partial [Durusdinium trenchii]